MATRTRARCWNCNAHRSEVGELSWSGLCEKCAQDRYTDNVVQMVAKSGPNWLRRTAGMKRYMARLLLDDAAAGSHAAGNSEGS